MATALGSAMMPTLAEAARGREPQGAVGFGVLGSEAVLGRVELEPSQSTETAVPAIPVSLPSPSEILLAPRIQGHVTHTPDVSAGWAVGGMAGLVVGVVLTALALEANVPSGSSLTDMMAHPMDNPLLAAGGTSLLAGFVIVRAKSGPDARHFVWRPMIGYGIDRVSVGVGGRF